MIGSELGRVGGDNYGSRVKTGLLFVEQDKLLDILREAVGGEEGEVEYGFDVEDLVEEVVGGKEVVIDCRWVFSLEDR